MKAIILIAFSMASALLLGQTNSKEQELEKVLNQFQKSIEEKDSTSFYELFFSESVPFVGVMSEKTEWSIKKNYEEFEGVAVSDHKQFIRSIVKAKKPQSEKFYNTEWQTDGIVASISFDYTYTSGDRMIQWGNEKWNLVYLGEKWLITDVIYSIHFPDVEKCPLVK